MLTGKVTIITIAALAGLVLGSSMSFAGRDMGGMVVFTEEYTYQASEYDSKVTCRAFALDQVKRLLLEKIGTYLESETEVRNFRLTKDQIVTLTAGIVSTEIIEEKWDGKTYYLKAKVAANPEDVANSIKELRLDRKKTKDLDEIRKKADEALKEVQRLRKELETAKTDKANLAQYNQAANTLSATDSHTEWWKRSFALQKKKDWQEMLEWDQKWTESEPEDPDAWNDLGHAYEMLDRDNDAIKAYRQAIRVDPKYADGWYNLGDVYHRLKRYNDALEAYRQVVRIAPEAAWTWYHLGCAYHHLKRYNDAIKALRQAMKIDPEDFRIRHELALVYGHSGNKREQRRLEPEHHFIIFEPADETGR